MQLIRDIYAARKAKGQPVISFEFFPPKTDEGERSFFEKSVPALAALKPDYCSVTYGAGGSTRDKTLNIVDRIQREHKLPAMMHLTCVGSTADQIGEVLDQAKARGINNILALRGDPPVGTTEFQKVEGGFEFSYQLVQFIKCRGEFSVASAGFPEGHIACKEGKHADWNHLKTKVDAGADFILTQLFFDNADFYEFRDYVAKRGVNIPIVPGIIPIQSANQIKKFSSLCGSKIPPALQVELDKYCNDDQACAEFGIEYAAKQCEDLLRNGVPGLHFYTLNKAHSTTQVLKKLNLA
ncbi:MAG: methylenetetrahydrofolate reductase [NAD(P)H] [Limisphaerales bacterium]